MLALHSQMLTLQRSVEDVKASLGQHRVEWRREFQMMQSNIRRIDLQPVVRLAAAAAVANGPNGGARAVAQVKCVSAPSANPRTLYLLWEEYENCLWGVRQPGIFFQERTRDGKSSTRIIEETLSGIA
jgi:hypothetical protein